MPATSPRRAARRTFSGRVSQALTASHQPRRSTPRYASVATPSRGGENHERPLGRARQRARDLVPARTVRLGAAGLAALAVLSSATLASPAQIAVPAEGAETRVAAPIGATTPTYDLRSERVGRTDRSTTRPTASPSTKSPAATPAKKATKKVTAKQVTAKQVTAKQATAKQVTAKQVTAAKAPPAESVGTRYTRVDLNVRTQPSDSGQLLNVVDSGSTIKIAAQTSGAWQSVVYDGALGWVKKRYLVTTKPTSSTSSTSSSGSTTAGGLSTSPCASGSSVETGGLTRDAVAVHRAVCARFPSITSYGGVRADSLPEHPSGRAIDCMLPSYSSASGNALGWQVANWLKANAGRLGISQILFDQRIWTVQRGSEGWRSMSSRGGDTANHRDHVHVTVYGNAG